jgi:hypothetical protein
MKEKILEKARKLKALAGSSNPNEARLALQKMQAILLKYGLTEKDLEKDAFGRLVFEYSASPWVRLIIEAVANLYLCRSAFTRRSSGWAKYYIVGNEENAEVVREMCREILGSIRRESNTGLVDKRSFRNGASDRIALNCNELIKAAKNGQLQDDCGEALVIGDMYQKTFDAIDVYMAEGMNVTEAKPRRHAPLDKRSYLLGCLYGDTVELQKKMS